MIDNSYDKIQFENQEIPINFLAQKKLYNANLPFVSHLKWHEEFEIKQITDGQATFQIGTDIFDVKSGDIVICNPKELHCVKNIASYVEYNIAVFNLGFFSDNFGRLEGIKHVKPMLSGEINFYHLIRDDAEITFAVERLFEALLKNTENRILSVTGLLLYLFSLLFDGWINKTYAIKSDNYEKLNKLRPCIEFIDENYKNKDLSLSIVAKTAFISPVYLSRIFKEVLSVNFKDYIKAVRLSKAEIFLLSTDEKVNQIAEKVGFDDPCYFNRWFKKNTGFTPSEYRNKKNYVTRR